jgi:hypothetical protein
MLAFATSLNFAKTWFKFEPLTEPANQAELMRVQQALMG